MEFEKITPAGRRVQRVAIRIGIFAALYAAIRVNVLFEGSRYVTLLIIAIAFFLAYHFTARQWLRRVIVALAILVFLAVGAAVLLIQRYVSASAPSPDGRVVAEVHEVRTMPDYNFVVCLKTKGRWGTTHSTCPFRSPDEGPPKTQRLLWSKDGRYVLLLMTRKDFINAREEARLASGEYLYVLLDTEKDVVYTNARDVRDPHPFSVDDLSGVDFGESFTTAQSTISGNSRQ